MPGRGLHPQIGIRTRLLPDPLCAMARPAHQLESTTLMVRHAPLWLDRFPKSKRPAFPRWRGDAETGVVVIGGGLTGCSTALRTESGRRAGDPARSRSPRRRQHRGVERPHPRGLRRLLPSDHAGARPAHRANPVDGRAARLARLRRSPAAAVDPLRPRPDCAAPGVPARRDEAETRAGRETRRESRSHVADTGRGEARDRTGHRRSDRRAWPSRAIRSRRASVWRLRPRRGRRASSSSHRSRGSATGADRSRLRPRPGRIHAESAIVATSARLTDLRALRRHLTPFHRYTVVTDPLDAVVRKAIGPPAAVVQDDDAPSHLVQWLKDGRVMVTGADQPAVAPRTHPQALIAAYRSADVRAVTALSRRSRAPCRRGPGHRRTMPTADGLPYLGPHRNFPRHFFALGDARHGPGAAWLASRLAMRWVTRPAREGRRGLRVRPGSLTGFKVAAPGSRLAPGMLRGCSSRRVTCDLYQETSMASSREQEIDHILRRAGFGATEEEVNSYARLAFGGPTLVLARLLSYQQIADDVDEQIGKPGYVGITARGEFQPAANITDARQRWLFRMVHTDRPLQEKMALFWHNHFATGYTKIAGELSATEATRVLAAKPEEDAGGVPVSSSCFGPARWATSAICSSPWRRTRRCWCGWTAGPTCARSPQENFARELMELFTMGVGTLRRNRRLRGRAGLHRLESVQAGQRRRAALHASTTTPRSTRRPRRSSRSRSIADGGRIDPEPLGRGRDAGRPRSDHRGRPASRDRTAAGAQAVQLFRQRGRPARYRAHQPDVAALYYDSGSEISAVMRVLLLSPQFRDPANYYKRYSWPVEFVGAVAQGSRLVRLFGQRRAQPAHQHGPAVVRAARRRRLGSRSRVVLERRYARANELRRAAGDQPEVCAA